MYITPDLFDYENITPDGDTAPSGVFLTYDFQPSVLGKRRRIDGEKPSDLSPRSKIQFTVKGSEKNFTRSSPRSLPSPPPENDFGYELERTKPDLSRRNLSPPLKHRRRVIPLKRQRLSTPEKDVQIRPQILFNDTPILTPCHVCHKAPKLKRELDAYEDCWRCRERTCFICMRQCQAECGDRKVCRQCCVEQGEDGDVSCLDCLQHSQDQEMEG